jgi:hypothetical protein
VLLVLAIALSACSSFEPLDETLTERVDLETTDLPGRLWEPFLPPLDQGSPVTIEALLTVPLLRRPCPRSSSRTGVEA